MKSHEISVESPLVVTIGRHLIFQEDPAMTEARETTGQQWVIFHGSIIDSSFWVMGIL